VTRNWNSGGAKVSSQFGEIRAQFWLFLGPFHLTKIGGQI